MDFSQGWCICRVPKQVPREAVEKRFEPWQELNFSPCLKGNSNVSSIRDGDYAVHLHGDADLPVYFIFINLHDIYQAHLKTQQDYDPRSLWRSKQSDGFTAKCPSFDFARSYLEKKADIMSLYSLFPASFMFVCLRS